MLVAENPSEWSHAAGRRQSRKNSSATHPPRTSAGPRLDYESRATVLDCNELGALLVAAGLDPPAEHDLISLLALNGLRVSEATGAASRRWASSAGHRTLVITRKGAKVITIPLAPADRTDADAILQPP
jgi:hypothetical protein